MVNLSTMEKEIIYISNLHFEEEVWRRQLYCWQDELIFFYNRLSEMATRWVSQEELAKLEYFQNRFTRHDGVLEDLLEAIQVHEKIISGQYTEERINSNNYLISNHLDFRRKMESQQKFYTDLKKEFFLYFT